MCADGPSLTLRVLEVEYDGHVDMYALQRRCVDTMCAGNLFGREQHMMAKLS
jgi:hypothetical protein